VGSKTHRRLSFLVSFSLLPFSFFLRLSFILSGGSPFFFEELYRCWTLAWPVLLSRWLSTGGYGGWSSRYRGLSPRGEGLWQVPDWNMFHVGAHLWFRLYFRPELSWH